MDRFEREYRVPDKERGDEELPALRLVKYEVECERPSRSMIVDAGAPHARSPSRLYGHPTALSTWGSGIPHSLVVSDATSITYVSG